MEEVFYYDTNGVNQEAEKIALAWLASQNDERVILAYQNAQLEEFLGRTFQPASKILREKKIPLPNGVIHLHTKRNPMPKFIQANVLILYPTLDELKKLEEYSNLRNIFVIPWTTNEIYSWLTEHKATLLKP